jgi:hypothetical protein
MTLKMCQLQCKIMVITANTLPSQYELYYFAVTSICTSRSKERQTTAAKSMISEPPPHRWDLNENAQKGGVGSSAGLNANPAYRWDRHGKAEKKRLLRRTKSDITGDRMIHPGKGDETKCSKEAEDVLQSRQNSLVDSDSDESDRESESDKVSAEQSSDDETEEEEEEEEKEIAMGYNWKRKRPMILRSKSDITCYESNDIRKRRESQSEPMRPKKSPRVHFTPDDPLYIELPVLTDEDKEHLFFSKAELRSFRDDRDREKAEQQMERRNARFADNTANMDSFWGTSSKPKKIPDNGNKVVEKQNGEKLAKEAEKATEMNNVLDALQLAMAQAKLVTGY